MNSVAYGGTNKWTSIGPAGGQIISVAIDPEMPTTVYAATVSAGSRLPFASPGAVPGCENGSAGKPDERRSMRTFGRLPASTPTISSTPEPGRP